MTAGTTALARTCSPARLWPSLFLAGFECATGFNRSNHWIDQIAATHHDRFLREDYRRLLSVGIRAAREGIRWPLVDRGGRFDFSSVAPFVEAGAEFGITQIWDLFHYGYPQDLDPFSDAFVRRFASYCAAVARYLDRRCPGTLYITPVNEISYFAWAGGDAALFAPHAAGRSWELKVNLVRAAIAGINAFWDVVPDARIVNADPVCHVAARANTPRLRAETRRFNDQVVYQSWDMLAGRLMPELGGSRRHLDIVGVNYYWTNQWEHGRTGIPLADHDPRRVPLRDLISQVWERYGGDILITETSHAGANRGPWMRELTGEVRALWDRGVPLSGVCLYPILGMPEWHAPDEWARMGLWDLHPASATLRRVPCRAMLAALQDAASLEAHPFWRGASVRGR